MKLSTTRLLVLTTVIFTSLLQQTAQQQQPRPAFRTSLNTPTNPRTPSSRRNSLFRSQAFQHLPQNRQQQPILKRPFPISKGQGQSTLATNHGMDSQGNGRFLFAVSPSTSPDKFQRFNVTNKFGKRQFRNRVQVRFGTNFSTRPQRREFIGRHKTRLPLRSLTFTHKPFDPSSRRSTVAEIHFTSRPRLPLITTSTPQLRNLSSFHLKPLFRHSGTAVPPLHRTRLPTFTTIIFTRATTSNPRVPPIQQQEPQQGIPFRQQSQQQPQQSVLFRQQPQEHFQQSTPFRLPPQQSSQQGIPFRQQPREQHRQSIPFGQQPRGKPQNGAPFRQQPREQTQQGTPFRQQPQQSLNQGIPFRQQPHQQPQQSQNVLFNQLPHQAFKTKHPLQVEVLPSNFTEQVFNQITVPPLKPVLTTQFSESKTNFSTSSGKTATFQKQSTLSTFGPVASEFINTSIESGFDNSNFAPLLTDGTTTRSDGFSVPSNPVPTVEVTNDEAPDDPSLVDSSAPDDHGFIDSSAPDDFFTNNEIGQELGRVTTMAPPLMIIQDNAVLTSTSTSVIPDTSSKNKSKGAGAPGFLPPSDEVVAQLNSAQNFLALAESMQLRRRFKGLIN